MNSLTALFIFFCLLVAGCSVGPPYSPPCIEVPSNWKNPNACQCQGVEVNKDGTLAYYDYWWQVFEDERLNELEILALENNRNLFVAYERIREYRALMGIAAANFYPQLNLNPLYSNIGELIKTYGATPAILQNLDIKRIFRAHELLYALPLNLSYEVDLWGRIQDQYQNAKYNWYAQQKDYEVVMLSLTSSLATVYYQIRTADKQIELLAQILKTRQKSYQINLDRYEGQIIFYSDVALAGEEVNSVLTEYEEVIRQRKVLENQLAVLLGYPASEFSLEANPLQDMPPCIPEGIPSEIIVRRPDIAEAEYQTRATHALVKEAYSEFFPSLTLTGTAGFESPVFKDFLKWISRYWMEGFQINQLVFDGFRTPYNLKAQIARFLQASGQYQQTVLTAFQEVEDSLTDISSYAKEYESTKQAAEWAIKAYKLYSDRYALGLINYIDVVNTERDALNFQIDVNTIQGYRFLATIQLIKSLGGSWSNPLAANALEEEECD